jgi:hypothetical protein
MPTEHPFNPAFLVEETFLRVSLTPEEVIARDADFVAEMREKAPDAVAMPSDTDQLLDQYEEDNQEWLHLLGAAMAERILARDAGFFRQIAEVVEEND